MARILGIDIPPLFRAASPNNPTSSLARPEGWLTSLFAPQAKSGASVSPDTIISLPAVWRAINLISQSIAILPFEVVEHKEDGSVETANTHDLYHLLRYEPSSLYTSFTFLRALVAQACLYGNAYAIINVSEESGRPSSFKIVDQSIYPVEAFIGEDAAGNEVLYYKINGMSYKGSRVIHIQNLSFNGLAGNNLITTHRDNYGLALAARDFGNQFFKNGTFLSGYLSFQKSLNLDARRRNAESWQSAYSGSQGVGRVAVLDEGAEFKALNMRPADASMLETQNFSIGDVARITGVPPHMLYSLERATDNNIEKLGREFADFTLTPWATQIEQEFSRKVFRENEKRFTRARRSIYRMVFDMAELLRADSEGRAKMYQSGIQNGWMKPNEARRREGLNPVDGGEKNFMQLNMTTLDKVGEQFNQAPAMSDNSQSNATKKKNAGQYRLFPGSD